MKKQTDLAIKAHIIGGASYLLLLAAGPVMALFVPQPPTKVSHPAGAALTFAERVSYQRAIEEIYWRHRIWPKENLSAKPPLDAVVSDAELKKKVETYLRNSQALEDYYNEPLSADQLQAEMERMASQTKQPEVLRELFAALGNDPFVVAECLARPVLSERMISHSHVMQVTTGPLKPKAISAATATYTLPAVIETTSGCTDDTWTATSVFNAPDGRQSDKAVWTGTEMIIWGGSVADNNDFDTGGRYNPSTDSWTPTSIVNAPDPRVGHTAIWTGTEMIVWGGVHCCPLVYFNDGGRYNPGTDTWVATTTTGAPDGRSSHTAIWTGTEMIVWGASDYTIGGKNTGGRYNPKTDSWTATTRTNAPSGRYDHSAVWTGSEMIVWGGTNGYVGLDTGGRYNPATDSWGGTNTADAPKARAGQTAVWTGSEMIVWGGGFNTGGKYNPFTDSWVATSNVNAPSARFAHTAIWSGSEMIVWGGAFYDGSNYHYYNTGGRYNPFTDIWATTSAVNAPSPRDGQVAVWTGSEMIVWGGFFFEPGGQFQFYDTGGRYCAEVGPTPIPTPIPILLYVQKDEMQAIHTVHLSWSGATSNRIDVYRNNTVVTTTANDGAYKDSTGETGRADYAYKICEAGTQTCSNEVTVSFSKNVSATWSTNPVSGDWNNPLNWTPHTVPNGPLDIATFNTSSITNISVSHATEVAEIVFNAGASSFTVTCPKQLTLSGTGITNNSAMTQGFIANTQYVPILFTNSATAGIGTVFTNDGGYIEFDDSSTAASATFTTTIYGAYTIFHDNATCHTATFYNQDGGTTIPANGANATFINNAGGTTYLGIDDRAQNATLIANDGATIYFDAFSKGDTARVELFGNSYIDFSNAYEIELGSIEGDGGTMEIGDTEVTVGTNNLNTVFGGLIQDEFSEIFGGTLVKVGTGSLTLSSASTYRHGTVVSSGALMVDNIKGSATGTGTVQVNAGTLGGRGIITGPTVIGTGSGTGAFLAPAVGTRTGATLKIKSGLILFSDATYAYTYRAKRNTATTDLVMANGVTINSGATLDFDGTINGRLTPGLVFTAISNTSAIPISGTFSNLPDGSTVVLAGNTFQANYRGGDGNDLTLTVVP